jgi:hypothetical protein
MSKTKRIAVWIAAILAAWIALVVIVQHAVAYTQDADGYALAPGETVTFANAEGGTDGITRLADPELEEAAKAQTCRKAHWVTWHGGPLGKLAWWHFKQRYCYGPRFSRERGYYVPRVTEIGRPRVTCDPTGLARSTGWSCDGIVDGFGHWGRWHGYWRGKHVSGRKGHLLACFPQPFGCTPHHSYTHPMVLVVTAVGGERFKIRWK